MAATMVENQNNRKRSPHPQVESWCPRKAKGPTRSAKSRPWSAEARWHGHCEGVNRWTDYSAMAERFVGGDAPVMCRESFIYTRSSNCLISGKSIEPVQPTPGLLASE